MKTTAVVFIALTAASVSAQSIVVPREYNYAGVPRAVADLEARKFHINWRKVGGFAKTAAKIGASVLFRRMDEDELLARGFLDAEDLVTRDFDDDHLEARRFHINWHKVGNIAKGAAKIGASILFKRMDEDELLARGFIYKDDLVTRDFDDDDYLLARALKAHPHPHPHPGHPHPRPHPHPHPPSRPHPHPQPHPHPHPHPGPHTRPHPHPHPHPSGNSGWGNVDNFVKGAAKGLSKVDWGKVAGTAAEIGADILLKRMDEDDFYARGLVDRDIAGNLDDLD